MNTRELAQILLNIQSIGSERTKKILETYEGPTLSACINELYPQVIIDPHAVDKATRLAVIQKKQAMKKGISIISWKDTLYPSNLLTIEDFPPLLYFKGHFPILNRPLSAAVVGSRQATDHILKIGSLISEVLAYLGYTIVSGMALGCDTAAHIAAMQNRCPTVAVLPGGTDVIYPGENSFLYHRILESHGGLISEYVPGTPPAPFRFVRRDRLQSGLARFVVLLSSHLKGGAMHTASSAIRQRRPLFVYDPGNFHAGERGNQYLIHHGMGIPFKTPDDLIREISAIPLEIPYCQRS